MELRAIRTDADLDWALAEIEQYFDAPPEPENREYPIEELDPIETLKVFMDIKQRRQSDLAELVGGKSRASEIMNRKRPLTLAMIQKIHTSWKIPAAALIKPYHLETKEGNA
jgi:HTH-type transcriptional regulator/antitoxin HigA